MRVITGSAKGRRLEAPEGANTRPTAAKVKEAVFSMIQFEVEGAKVLDLFAGSGQMGIEALSRGARFCVFVDKDKTAQGILRQNLAHTRLADNARLVGTDALSYLNTAKERFDIVFIDPPYAKGLLPGALETLAALVSEEGAVICETAKGEALPAQAGCLTLRRERHYGKTTITLYRHSAQTGQ